MKANRSTEWVPNPRILTLAAVILTAPQSLTAADFTIPDGDVVALKSAITAANTNGENDVIRLAAGGTYTLTTVDNGINGLPVIERDGVFGLVVEGNGATIQRDGAAPDFRLLESDRIESLTLNDLTLRGGSAVEGPGTDEEGGAIFTEADSLTANRCHFEDNASVTYGGAVYTGGGTISMTDCSFSGNTAVDEGGALHQNDPCVLVRVTFTGNSVTTSVPEEAWGGAVYANDELELTDCDFVENTSAWFGGALAVDFGDVVITDCEFQSNSAPLGGAIYNDGEIMWNGGRAEGNDATSTLRGGGAVYNDSGLVVTGVTFEANTSSAHGGAIVTHFGDTEARNVTFRSNSSRLDGGAMANFDGDVLVEDCLFDGNFSLVGGFGSGGAMDFDPDTSGRILNSMFTGNFARGGGAVHSQGEVLIRDSHFSMNSADATTGGAILNFELMEVARCTFDQNQVNGTGGGGNGGAICNFEASDPDVGMTVSDCEFTGNSAGERGGGIYNAGGAVLLVQRCVFENNETLGTGPGSGGGGFHDQGNGVVILRNSTFVGNSATRKGGGLYFGFGSERVVDSCTIVGNASLGTDSGDGGGGIINAASGVVEVGNSIVADNTAAAGGADLHGTITSLGFNLIGTTSGATIDGDTTGQITGVDPMLGSLSQNDGLVRTMVPTAGSPAIDAGRQDTTGILLTSDARQFSRPRDLATVANAPGSDATDIGAVEIPPDDVPQSGTVITVNTTDGAFDGVAGTAHTSLPDAVFAAASGAGNVVRFDPAVFPPATPKTIPVTSTMLVSGGSFRIEGTGRDFLTVERPALEGLPDFPVFFLEPGAEVEIAGITITGGAAIDPSGGEFPAGGGIRNEGTLDLDACAVSGNTGLWGGGIFNSGSLTAAGCLFENNTVTSTLRNGRGGAIYLERDSVAVITGSTFADNSSIEMDNRLAFAGAIQNFHGHLTLVGCGFFRNVAGTSGAIDSSLNAHIEGCVFEENRAFTSNGAIAIGDAELVTDCRFTRNIAENGIGGAIRVIGTGSIIRRCLFEENQAFREGGALDIRFPATVENCTFTGNSTDTDSTIARGGAIRINLLRGGTTFITHSTIQGNTSYAGGGIDLGNGTLEASHTILANNTATTVGNDMRGNGVSLGYCLQKDTVGGGLSGGAGDIFNVDPQLLPLADNGSFNGLRTHALAATSPALDTGDPAFAGPPFSDQRGQARVAGSGIDIGAHENSDSFQTYAQYAAATFPPGADPDKIAIGGDFDGDSIINGLERFMGTDATAPESGPGLVETYLSDGALVLRLPMARSFPPGDVSLQHGTDLAQWFESNAAVWEIIGNIDATTDLLEIRVPFPGATASFFARFTFP